MRDGSHIKPNQTFLAFPHEIPEAFRDLIKPVNKADLEEPPVVLESVTKFAVKERAPGWFDVIEENTGKVLNQSALRKDEAEKLAQELE